ncbi:EsaB/YukD family protein [Pseudonocardia spinosispora]|uniref:EsaB/YukD family protein n=1 Tax=Pseudonocardia spinosispora TaxID=103441 RepID=UPI0012EB167B|nr:EsaB/YukD family protein [Pseudonocardia spinosispora]
MDDERRRVTVVGAHRRVDLAVPAHAAIAEYAPNLLVWCGQLEFDNTFPPAWSLALPGAAPFPPEVSLAEVGVVDGATLYLRDAVAGEYDEPRIIELEDLVTEANKAGTSWSERFRAFSMVCLGILAVVAGFAALLNVGDQRPGVMFGTVLAGSGLASLSWHAGRASWPLPVAMRVLVALGAVPMFAIACAALPHQDDTGHLIAALTLGAMLGAAAALAAIRHVATLLILGVAMVAFPVVGLIVWLHAGPPKAAAVVALVGILALALAPSVSGKLAELTAPGLPATVTPATQAAMQDEIAHLVVLGRRSLVVITGFCAVVLAVAVTVLGGADDSFALAMAVCVSLTLLVRSGQTQSLSTVVPVVTAGCVGLVAVMLHAGTYLGGPAWAGPLVLLVLSFAAVVIGVTGAVGVTPPKQEPSRKMGALHAVLLFASVMCAVGVFGVFTLLMHLGEGI